ncbi:hypothetical protein [Streptomyces sp. NPDC054842]
MNGAEDERRSGYGTAGAQDEGHGFEERMRALLAEDAYTIRPSAVPYTEIRRRGLTERRRRAAVTGAVLVSLVALPVGTYALAGEHGERGARTAAAGPSDGVPRTTSKPSTAQPSSPNSASGTGQLLDGITFAEATAGLETCLTAEGGGPSARGRALGKAEDYRIILAAKSNGARATGDGFHVVAVSERSAGRRVVCGIENGEPSGISTGTSDSDPPDAGPVVPDVNASELFRQPLAAKGDWQLPFRWGVVGTVESSVAKVSVSYGGATHRAVLDHGWFVASGVLDRQVTTAPHIKGYDDAGDLVYDSDEDKYWPRNLP